MLKFCSRSRFAASYLLLSALFACSSLRAAPLPDIPPPAVSSYKTFGSGVPLAEFLKLHLRGSLGHAYVLSAAAAADTFLISADLAGVKTRDLLPLIRQVLDSAGYALKDVNGVFFVDKKLDSLKKADDDAAKDIFVYRPKYRAVSSLSSYFSMFPKLQYASAAGTAVRALSPAMPASAPASGPGGSSAAPLGSDFSSGASTFSQADGDPSLLIVRGDSAQLVAFKKFLTQIDIPVPEVLVRAYILEIQDSKTTQSGASLAMSLLSDRLNIKLGSAPAAGDSVQFSLPALSLSAAVASLAGDSRIRLLSAPVLRAADGSTSSSSVGTDTPTLGAVTTQSGAATQSVTYQSAGVLLTVSPRVFENSIRLKISQEVSSFAQTDTGLSATPTKLRRSFINDVITKSGDVVLLGSLSETKNTASSNKSFSFFGTSSTQQSTSDIVILLGIESL